MEKAIEELDTKCRRCQRAVEDEKFVAALDHVWHCHCFACTVCGTELTCTYYTHDGEPYCTKDFFTRFGSICKGCDQCITGPLMCAGSEQYHPECFLCNECQMPIGEGDSFALVDRRKLFCNRCFNQHKARLSSRVLTRVQLPPGKLDLQITPLPKTKKKRKRFLHIFRKAPRTLAPLDKNNGAIGIEEGDQIIEVNGAQVKGQTTEEVMGMIQAQAKSGVTLTIERHNHRDMSSFPTKRIDELCDRPRSESADKFTVPMKRSLLHSTTSVGVTKSRDQMPQTTSIISTEGEGLDNDSTIRKALSLSAVSPLRTGSDVMTAPPCAPRTPRGEGKLPICPLHADDLAGSMISPQSELGQSSDDDEEDIDGDSIKLQSRRPSALHVTKMYKKAPTGAAERQRTSTLPGRVYGKDVMSTIDQMNSVLYRGETFTSKHPASRGVFRTNDLEMGEVLGQGFFGRAVKVTNKANGDVMVMKELMKCTAEARQNFLQEVQMMKALDHINVMSLLGIMYRGRNLCIITEFIGGGTLSERVMDKTKSLPDHLKISFACDIAAGMAYLHANKIIHRDLTSNNCMIRLDESVVVGDFGLAKVLARPVPSQLSAVGSAYWMAPEMMAGKGYDFRADIFSFGIITCELIGRISADPDEMPRTMDFGLDEAAFRRDYLGEFSSDMFEVPVLCCNLDPQKRPRFGTLEAYLHAALSSIASSVVFNQRFTSFVRAFESQENST